MLSEGATIGAYRIERMLGRGGFGVVYVAHDAKLNRRVALKQLLPQHSDKRDLVERFFNEARAAAAIDHPGIVPIYDVDWHTDDSAYFTMKLLEGETLGARLRKRGQLSIAVATTIGASIGRAIAAAHARGIVHRDLKPDNIMLVRDADVAGGERPIILDFGIAKLVGDEVSSTVATSTAQMLGTPLYMSPEQCRGAGEVDHRTDVYALACIVFEMLASRPPHVGKAAGEILGMHQFVEPPSLRSLRPDVPQNLAALVAKNLAKDPAERAQTIDEFAIALEPFTTRAVSTPPEVVAPAAVDPHGATMASISKAPTAASPAPPPRPRVGLFIGGAILATGIAIAIGFAARSPSTTTPTDAAIATDGAERVVDIVTPDADAVVTPPLPDAKPKNVASRDAASPPIDAPLTVTATTPIATIRAECTKYETNRQWNELLQCSQYLRNSGDPTLAEKFQDRGKLERNAVDAQKKLLEDFEKDVVVNAARVLLSTIPPESDYHQDTLAAFRKAEIRAVDLALAKMSRSDCAANEPVLRKLRSQQGSVFEVTIRARVQCTKTKPEVPEANGDCDMDHAREWGNKLVGAGAFADAMLLFENMVKCTTPNEEYYARLVASACRAKDARSKQYMPKLGVVEQIQVGRLCN